MNQPRPRQPESAPRESPAARRARAVAGPISGALSARALREPGARETAARDTDPLRTTTTSARLRRPSSLPQRLLFGRLVRGGALLGVAGLAAVGVVQVAAFVERSDALPVRSVAVHGPGLEPERDEADRARVEEILAYAGVEPGLPLFAIDIDAVAARVLEHPFVAAATVRRVPPDGIEIAVETRAPRAVLAADGLYLVDGKGQVMKTARPGDGLDLPVVTGIAAADVASGQALDVLAAAVDLLEAHVRAGSPGGEASEVSLIPGVGFELVLEDGTRVRVGDDGPEAMTAKLARLDAVVRRLSAEGRRASFIYLDDERRPERAAVRLRPEAETPPVGG